MLKTPERNSSDGIGTDDMIFASIVAAMAMLVFLLRFPVATVTHVDAFAYIEGAHSLKQGLGYVDAAGNPLNHWPVGYSLILSQFPDALTASRWLNAISLAVAVIALTIHALAASWPRLAALAFAASIGFGFFASLGSSAMPEMLTYAIFLVATFLVVRIGGWWRLVGFAAVAVLAPLKLIAVVFVPALMLFELWRDGWRTLRGKRFIEYAAIGVLYSSTVLGLLYFNQVTATSAIPVSHPSPSASLLLGEVVRFFHSHLRTYLSIWYGSIREPLYFGVFMLTLLAGIIAHATLRLTAANRDMIRLGIVLLGLSWALELVRVYYAGPRLMGYATLALVLGCAPAAGEWARWAVYAGLLLFSGGLNSLLVPNLGASSPEYKSMSAAITPHLPLDRPMFSNSESLLDLHSGRATIMASEWPSNAGDACMVWVLLPNRDAIATLVWPLPEPPVNWKLVIDAGASQLWCMDPV